jgi:hypothetical protein
MDVSKLQLSRRLKIVGNKGNRPQSYSPPP